MVVVWPGGFTLSPADSLTPLCSTAEQLLPGAQFYRYVKDERSVVRSPSPYTLHKELAEHLDFGTENGGRRETKRPPAGSSAQKALVFLDPSLASWGPLGESPL